MDDLLADHRSPCPRQIPLDDATANSDIPRLDLTISRREWKKSRSHMVSFRRRHAVLRRARTPLHAERAECHAAWRHRMWRRIFMLQLTKASAVDSPGELETQECKCFRTRLRTNTEQSEPNASRGASKVANPRAGPRAKIFLNDVGLQARSWDIDRSESEQAVTRS